MDVYLNGRHQIVRDTNPYVTYKLNFSEGKNIVRIIITDDDGRVKEFSYTVNYVKPDDNEKIGTVTVSMDANVLGLGSMISGATTDLLAGDNAAKVIVRVLESKGFGCISSGSTDQGFYLSAISRSGIGRTEHIPEALKDEIDDHGITWQGSRDEPERSMNSLGEKDYTQGSGWIILGGRQVHIGECISCGSSRRIYSQGEIHSGIRNGYRRNISRKHFQQDLLI